MRCTLVREERYFRTPGGEVYSRWGTGAATWAAYVAAFDGVRVAARILDVGQAEEGWTECSHRGVEFAEVPYFHGPAGYLKRMSAVKAALEEVAADAGALVLRIPSPLANAISGRLVRAGRPYAVEVAGDPYDQFSPGAVKHPLRALFRRYYTGKQRAQCESAKVARYVTERALQARYPPGRGTEVYSISDVHLPEGAIAAVRRCYRGPSIRLVYVGMMEQLYKCPDVLLKALAKARVSDGRLSLRMVGDGGHRKGLEELSGRLGIADSVEFLGVLARERIEEVLDESHIFVLPSKQEGMPRAMIEAMARAMPCIGTRVGGVPELLSDEFLVRPGDADELAGKIVWLAARAGMMEESGERNRLRSLDYGDGKRRFLEEAFVRSVAARCGRG